MMTLSEKDWKPKERKAYRLEESIEFFAKMDSFRTNPRWNSLTIDIDTLPDKVTADGQSYKNMWSRHKLPDIVVGNFVTVQRDLTKAANTATLSNEQRLNFAQIIMLLIIS